jgi:hypothetical protein
MRVRPIPLFFALFSGACASSPTTEPKTAIEIPVLAADGKETSNAKHSSPETECDRVTDTVNPAVTEIERISQERTTTDVEVAGGMRKIAVVWSKLGDDLAALDISSIGLRDTVRQYRSMCRKGTDAANDLASALERSDPPANAQARRKYDEVAAEEDGLVDKINSFCQ